MTTQEQITDASRINADAFYVLCTAVHTSRGVTWVRERQFRGAAFKFGSQKRFVRSGSDHGEMYVFPA
jgi:hypothetical protein